MIIVLDSNILGFLTNQNSQSDMIRQCQEWLYKVLSRGHLVYSSDICDYELRRELLRINSQESIQELDRLRAEGLITFLTVDIHDLRMAADLWSNSRKAGKPNKDQKNIDVDCILSAQCRNLKKQFPGHRVVLATMNLKDFEEMIDCASWADIG